VPNGDPAVIVDRALTLLVRDLERGKFAAKKGRSGQEPLKPSAKTAATRRAEKSAKERAARRPAGRLRYPTFR
jgi:hypothetical protein